MSRLLAEPGFVCSANTIHKVALLFGEQFMWAARGQNPADLVTQLFCGQSLALFFHVTAQARFLSGREAIQIIQLSSNFSRFLRKGWELRLYGAVDIYQRLARPVGTDKQPAAAELCGLFCLQNVAIALSTGFERPVLFDGAGLRHCIASVWFILQSLRGFSFRFCTDLASGWS